MEEPGGFLTGRKSRIGFRSSSLVWEYIWNPTDCITGEINKKVCNIMAQTYIGQKRLRKYYGKIREVLDMPNLIEVQNMIPSKTFLDSKYSDPKKPSNAQN